MLCARALFTMETVITPELQEKLSDLSKYKPSSNDGKNFIAPFLVLFQKFLGMLEFKLDQFKKDMLDTCLVKDTEIATLHQEVRAKQKQITDLEHKIDDSDQYIRRETLIFSGETLPVVREVEDCADIVCKLITEKLGDLHVQPTDISIAHRLGPKPAGRPDRRSIVAKFVRRSVKYQILNASRSRKPPGLFVNESLTKPRQTITSALRNAKRQFPDKISGYSTTDGSIFVWVKPPLPSAPGAKNFRVSVNTMEKLEQFCQKKFNLPAANFITANGPRQN